MIKVILFDYVGVLVGKFTPFFYEYVCDVTGISKETVKEVFQKHWSTLKLGRTSDEEFFRNMKNDLNISEEQIGNIKEFVRKLFLPTTETILHLKNLVDKYGLYLLSNSCYYWSEYSFDHNGLKPYFKKAFFSHNVGLAKPDPKIYELVIESIGVHPGQILFVDDKPKNVEVAKKMGMQAIIFTDFHTLLKELTLLDR